jgi:hypothetical protein
MMKQLKLPDEFRHQGVKVLWVPQGSAHLVMPPTLLIYAAFGVSKGEKIDKIF